MWLPKINKTLFILKAHFFLSQAATGPTQTAMPVYAKTLGFSSFVVGTIYTILPLVSLVVKPGMGAVADHFKAHKMVMLIIEAVLMVSYFSIQFIPSDFTPGQLQNNSDSSRENVMCSNASLLFYCTDQNDSYVMAELYGKIDPPLCSVKCSLTPEMRNKLSDEIYSSGITHFDYVASYSEPFTKDGVKCNQLMLPAKSLGQYKNLFCGKQSENCKTHCTRESDEKEVEDSQPDSVSLKQYQFYVFIILMAGAWGGTAVFTTLSDTITIEICRDDPHLYGKQRLWASIGYGLLSLISGFIIDSISGDGPKDYTPAFYLCLVVMSADIIMAYFYIDVKIPEQSSNIAKDVWQILKNVRVLVFCLWSMAMGISLALIWTFLYWQLEYLADQTGDGGNIKTIEGLTNVCQTFLGETPAFFFAGWVIKRIGHGHTWTVILGAIGLRFTLYSVITSPWVILAVEPLQLYYGLFYSNMTSFANIIAKPGTAATVQSLLCAICEGIGVAIGSFVGGLLYDDLGGATTFRIFGIAFLIMAVLNEIIEYLYQYLPENLTKIEEKKTEAVRKNTSANEEGSQEITHHNDA